MAHARNLSVMEASGEYIIISSTDIYPYEDFIPTIRQKIKSACRNPLLKRIAEKKIPQYDICENINDEEIEEFLKEKRESCEAS